MQYLQQKPQTKLQGKRKRTNHPPLDDVEIEDLSDDEESELEDEDESSENDEFSFDEDDLLNEINEPEQIKLTDRQREYFEYFTPVDGMEQKIVSAISAVKQHLESDETSGTGNLLVIGGRGSGKTTLAKGIIEVLRESCGRPGRNVGRIDGDKLNNKDLQVLYSKIRGGCLVIEHAGEVSMETATSLSLLMENDHDGTLVILEDSKDGINHAIRTNGHFGEMFTESVSIPVFTVKELVTFGQKYARDNGYDVDELAVLAMYDRINSVQRLDRPTYLTEVAEIMDEAIERSSRKGFFHRKRVNEDGMSILMEKDFM